MRLTQVVSSDGMLLDYAMITNPDPLNVGATASLIFAISAPRSLAGANVSQISFVLPVGNPDAPDPTDLTDVPPSQKNAAIAYSGKEVWTIEAGQGDGVFIAKPPAGGVTMGADSLTVSFTGITISPLVGTALLEIAEWADPSGDGFPSPDDPPTGTGSIAVPKFPANFYAGAFQAIPGEVKDGKSSTLSWIGSSEGTYKIYSGINPPVDVSDKRSWPTPNLTDTTSFVLEASAQEGDTTVYLYFNTTVTVYQPSLDATDLTVETTSALLGDVTIGTPGAPAFATVNGALSATGSITTSSGVIANTASVGDLGASGLVSASTVSTNTLNSKSSNLGTARVNGLNAGSGPVLAMGGAQVLTAGSLAQMQAFLPPTDGFVLGNIMGPQNYPTGGCLAYAAVSQGEMTIWGTGGNVGFFGPSWDDCMGNNWTSFMAPVAGNQYFYLGAEQATGDCIQTDAAMAFYFVPFGAGAADATVKLAPEAPPRALIPSHGDKKRRDWEAPKEFIAVLDTLLDKPIDPIKRQQLIDILHRM